MQSRGEPSWAKWIGNTAVVVIVLIWLFPVYWIVATSLKKTGDIINPIPSFIFFDPTLDNYRTIFGPTYTFADIVLNSFIIASGVTVLVILLAIPAAYSLARWDTKGSERIAMWILSLRMLPPVAVVIPYYVLATRLELIDTYAVLIIVHMAFGLPFAVWLMRGFFAEIPRELDQAAMLDGYSYLAVLRKIIIPLAMPSIAVTAIFTFIFSWNEFLLALLLTDTNAVTVPVQISKMILAYQVLWGELSAAGVIALLPLIFVVFALQRYIVRGLTLGAVK
jgi:multiple sugar transport system permease protein